MNDLIIADDCKITLTDQAATQLATLENIIKDATAKRDNLRALIKAEMEEKHIIKLDTPDFTISYRQPYNKENFDKAKFKKKYPSIYDEYVTFSTVGASIQVKFKE